MEVVIVTKDKNFVFVTFQIILSSFEYFNNSQELLIMDLIFNLYKNYLYKKKGY